MDQEPGGVSKFSRICHGIKWPFALKAVWLLFARREIKFGLGCYRLKLAFVLLDDLHPADPGITHCALADLFSQTVESGH